MCMFGIIESIVGRRESAMLLSTDPKMDKVAGSAFDIVLPVHLSIWFSFEVLVSRRGRARLVKSSGASMVANSRFNAMNFDTEGLTLRPHSW